MTAQDLLDLRDCVSIARHEPGLLQLKLNLAILQRPAARELISLGRGRTGSALLDADFNIFTRSATLEYATALVNPEDIDRFFSSDDPDEVSSLAGKVAGVFGLDLNLA
jgi:hypothetical protein